MPGKKSMSTSTNSTTTTSNAPPINGITPLHEKESDRNFLQRLWDRYSITQQTTRILVAESFLQAATRQASDP
jgi:hypothetical protein